MNYQETSREAWRSFIPHSKKLDIEIMEALEASEGGLTCNQIEQLTGRTHQAVSGNMTHLKDKGLVMPSGRYGKSPSGRKAIIWVIGDGRE